MQILDIFQSSVVQKRLAVVDLAALSILLSSFAGEDAHVGSALTFSNRFLMLGSLHTEQGGDHNYDARGR